MWSSMPFKLELKIVWHLLMNRAIYGIHMGFPHELKRRIQLKSHLDSLWIRCSLSLPQYRYAMNFMLLRANLAKIYEQPKKSLAQSLEDSNEGVSTWQLT